MGLSVLPGSTGLHCDTVRVSGFICLLVPCICAVHALDYTPTKTLPGCAPAAPQELVEIVGRSAGVVVMAPPGDSPEARAALATLLSAVKPGKQRVVIAESYGGRDEPVDSLRAAFVGAGVEPLLEPLRVREAPGEGTYQAFEESGTDLAQALTQVSSLGPRRPGAAGRARGVAQRIALVLSRSWGSEK